MYGLAPTTCHCPCTVTVKISYLILLYKVYSILLGMEIVQVQVSLSLVYLHTHIYIYKINQFTHCAGEVLSQKWLPYKFQSYYRKNNSSKFQYWAVIWDLKKMTVYIEPYVYKLKKTVKHMEYRKAVSVTHKHNLTHTCRIKRFMSVS